MATLRFTGEEATDAVFDNDFSLSEGESSEEGDNLYALLGEAVIRRSDIEALTCDLVVSNGDSDSISNSNDIGDRASNNPGDVPLFTDSEDPLVSDENIGSSPPSSTLGPSSTFAGNSRGDHEGEISDEEPMVLKPWLLLLI